MASSVSQLCKSGYSACGLDVTSEKSVAQIRYQHQASVISKTVSQDIKTFSFSSLAENVQRAATIQSTLRTEIKN